MMKEIKIVDERETLVYREGKDVLQINTDNPSNGKDGFCFVIMPDGLEENGVAIALPFEEVKNVLNNNATFELHEKAYGFIPITITISVKEQDEFKNIKIVLKDEMEIGVFEGEFKLQSKEVKPIIEFCEKFM